jgi:ATPase subunit of ABC transporter with duplicated ATPase domains
MREGRNFGLSGQNYDNFLCLTKECKQKAKEKSQLRREKEKLKLESKQLKNDAKRAKIETMRSQTKQDEKMSEVMNAQVAPASAAAEKSSINQPAPEGKKKDHTVLIVSAVGGFLLLVGIAVVVSSRMKIQN